MPSPEEESALSSSECTRAEDFFFGVFFFDGALDFRGFAAEVPAFRVERTGAAYSACKRRASSSSVSCFGATFSFLAFLCGGGVESIEEKAPSASTEASALRLGGEAAFSMEGEGDGVKDEDGIKDEDDD